MMNVRSRDARKGGAALGPCAALRKGVVPPLGRGSCRPSVVPPSYCVSHTQEVCTHLVCGACTHAPGMWCMHTHTWYVVRAHTHTWYVVRAHTHTHLVCGACTHTHTWYVVRAHTHTHLVCGACTHTHTWYVVRAHTHTWYVVRAVDVVYTIHNNARVVCA
jgi:hypothetical protein